MSIECEEITSYLCKSDESPISMHFFPKTHRPMIHRGGSSSPLITIVYILFSSCQQSEIKQTKNRSLTFVCALPAGCLFPSSAVHVNSQPCSDLSSRNRSFSFCSWFFSSFPIRCENLRFRRLCESCSSFERVRISIKHD